MNRAPRRGSGTGWAIAAVLAVAAVSWIGCDSASKWPDPAEQLPGWLYDAPFYAMPQPENDPQALDGGLDGQIPHYYIREPVIPIKRPDTSPAGKTPRLAVFWSNDHGQVWHKAGYFGLDSAYFSFVAPGEGTYGIRFVGPGIEPTRLKDSAAPHRVYHVDTTPPSVIVQVYPAKDFYLPGEAVTLVWSVTDANIDRDGKVAIYLISPPAKVIPMPAPFPLNGSVGIIVPDLAQDGGVRYGVEAVDKAGNIGRGFSFLVQTTSPATQPQPGGAMVQERTRPLPAGPSPAPGQTPTLAASPIPPSNTDRVPLVGAPLLPLSPALPADPATRSAPISLAPVDQVIEQSYRPKIFPTSQGE